MRRRYLDAAGVQLLSLPRMSYSSNPPGQILVASFPRGGEAVESSSPRGRPLSSHTSLVILLRSYLD